MALELWTIGDLMEILDDPEMDPIPDFWQTEFFPRQYFSEDKEIVFAKLPTQGRKLAPFVLPTEMGKPIFSAKGESLMAFKPPYIKPKDAVRPEDLAGTKRAAELVRGAAAMNLAQKFDARTRELVEFHRRAIKMRWAHMCAQAVITNSVTMRYESDQGAAYPEVTITFDRDPNHTVVLTGSYWSDPDYDIYADVNAWLERVRKAVRGGNVGRMILGRNVVGYFRNNKRIKEEMNTQYRGNDTNIRTGIVRTGDRGLAYIGTLGGGLEVYTYADQVENNDGSMVDLMDPNSVFLDAPGVNGVLAFGAIYDPKALASGQSLQTDIFVKMFETEDPGERYVMSQSAPLPIPVNGNRTLLARVLP